MKNSQQTTIGIITKTHGFEGAVTVKLTNRSFKEPKINEPVFIVIDGIPVPFFTRDVYYPGGDSLVISFDDYLTAESISVFKGCEIRCEGSANEDIALTTIIGYIITDVNSRFSATIISIDEQPGQLLATVSTGGGEFLIPLHPDLIVSVNHRKKTVKMSLPEGLADINS
jgi:16S rRNA processing protein RimM